MKIIEFLGLPRAGKTQHAEALERKLRELLFNVRLIPDQIKNAPFTSGLELERNRWSIREAGNTLSEAKTGAWDFIIGDRLGWAHYASVEALLHANLITGEENVQRAIGIERIAMDVVSDEDFFILIKVPVSLVIERHLSLGGSLNGVIMNKNTLTKMEAVYRKIERELPKKQTLVINGGKDFFENQSLILNRIIPLATDKQGDRKSDDRKTSFNCGDKTHEKKEECYGLGGIFQLFF